MISAYYAIKPVRNIYEANALIAITMQANEEKSGMDVQLASVKQNLLSRANLEPIVLKYNLYKNSKSDIEAAVNSLRKDLNIETKVRDYYPQFPVSFSIAYKHQDPALATQVTNDLASYFDTTNILVEKQNADEIAALEAATIELERQLKLINQQRVTKELASGNLSVLKAQRASLISVTEALTDKEFGLNQRITELKRQLSEQEKLLKALPDDSGVAARSGAYGVLLTEKARLAAQLKDQKSQYTEKNQKVIQTQSQIAEVNRQLGQIEDKENQLGLRSASPVFQELRSLQREQATLQTELELTQRDLKRKQQALELLPDIELSPADIASVGTDNLQSGELNIKNVEVASEYTLLFNRYNSLMEKLDTLKRYKRGFSGLFQVVDRAVIPTNPVAPNKLKLMLIGSILAICVGVLAAFVVEMPRLLTIQDSRDIEYLLGAPVIGLIPETLTPSENRYNRKLFLVRALSVLLLAATLIPFLIIILNRLQIFQMLAK